MPYALCPVVPHVTEKGYIQTNPQGKTNMTTVTQMKCACPSCLCIVNLSDAIEKEGKTYCSTACADGHPSGSGCGHTGCECSQ